MLYLSHIESLLLMISYIYHLKKIGKDSKTFQEIYPDPDPITMKTAENARDTVKKYEECTMGLAVQ